MKARLHTTTPVSGMRSAGATLAADEMTAQRAFVLWRQRGQPVGRETEIWHEAEAQLAQERDTAAAKPAISTS